MSKFTVKDIKGLIPPMLTAFTREGELYEQGIRNITSFLLEEVDGLFICGTYGSGILCNVEERKRVAEVVLDEVRERIPVIVHIGSADTGSAVKLAQHAEKTGAAAVSSVAPFYNPYTEEEIFTYFKTLSDAVSIPFFAYNNPKTSGNPITPEVLRRLAEAGVAGLKDSSFNILDFYKFTTAIAGLDFSMIVGTEALIYPAVAAGAVGSIAGAANVYPREIKKYYDACIEGKDWDTVWQLQERTLAIRDTIKMGPTIPICHEILQMLGIDGGYARAPFLPIPDELKKKVRSKLEDLKLL